jgi:hypothetical protein
MSKLISHQIFMVVDIFEPLFVLLFSVFNRHNFLENVLWLEYNILEIIFQDIF